MFELDENDYLIAGVHLTSSQVEDPYRELSTQQTSEYLQHIETDSDSLNDYDLPQLTGGLLEELEVDLLVQSASQVTCTQSTTTTTSTGHSSSVSTLGGASGGGRKNASPKRESYIRSVRQSSVPDKTRNNTTWAVKVWTDWAKARNEKLLPEEHHSAPCCTS